MINGESEDDASFRQSARTDIPMTGQKNDANLPAEHSGIVLGFLVMNSDGEFLTGGYEWGDPGDLHGKYLHLEKNIGEVLRRGALWKKRPSRLIPARYDACAPLSERTIATAPPITIRYGKRITKHP